METENRPLPVDPLRDRRLLACSLDLLEQFREYSERMREYGRGFGPSGIDVDSVILGLCSAIGVNPQVRKHRDGTWHAIYDYDRSTQIARIMFTEGGAS